MGRLPESEWDYRHALALRPDNIDALTYLASAQEKLGGDSRLREALSNLNKYLYTVTPA